MSHLRKLWESVAYAGINSGGARQRHRFTRWLGPLSGPLERFLNGGAAPSDPFYLTNRTLSQRLRLAVVVIVPCLAVVCLLALALTNHFHVKDAPQKQLTPAELAHQIMPDVPKDLALPANHDLEVVEATVNHGTATTVSGSVRNNTDRSIDDAEVIFELTTVEGTRLGAVNVPIPHVAPRATADFRLAVDQDTAYYALLREVVLK